MRLVNSNFVDKKSVKTAEENSKKSKLEFAIYPAPRVLIYL